jgi:hypothetical protein
MIRQLKSLVATLVIGIFVIAASVSAQSILGPGSPPPTTAGAPITMDTRFQDKNGNFRAESLYVDSSFCIGTDCRTSWANAGAGVCKIETRRVDASSGGFFISGPTSSCNDFLTSAAKAAGWSSSGIDSCVNIGSRDCQAPSTCIFTRLNCSGTASNGTVVREGPLFFPVPGFTKGTTYVCSDTLDNDGDGKFDYPADPDCTGFSDGSENTASQGGPRGWFPGGAIQ